MSFGGKVYSYPENFRALKILIAAKYGGHDVKFDEEFQFGSSNLSPAFLAKFPLGKVPCVELNTGKLLDESNSAAWLLAPRAMTGGDDQEAQSAVLRWVCLSETEVTPAACSWLYPLLGLMPASPEMARGRRDLLSFLTLLNTELRLKTWLVGERMTLADVCLASSLILAFTNAIDEELKVTPRIESFLRYENEFRMSCLTQQGGITLL